MSERKPLQLTIKLPRPIITGSSVGSEEVSGTTTSSTTPRCTGRTRHPRLRAPFSPQTVRTTEISGQESHFIRILGFIKKVWKCESGKGSACILSYSSKLISQIVEIEPSPDPRLARLRLPSSTHRRRRHRPQHCQRATTSSRDITSDSTTKRASRAHPLPARPPPSPPRPPPPQVLLAQTHWLFSRWNRRQPRRRQRRKLPLSDRLTISNITPL